MKKVNKKNKTSGIPIWLVAILVIVLGFLVYAVTSKPRDSRSSADDSVEDGVVLPVASDKE